jgi:hypothetical protein
MGPWDPLGYTLGGIVLGVFGTVAWQWWASLGRLNLPRHLSQDPLDPGYGLAKQLDIIRNARFGTLRVIRGMKDDKKEDGNEG